MTTPRRRFVVALGAAALGAASRARSSPSGRRTWRACVIGRTGRGDYGHGLDVTFQRIPGIRVAGLADPDETGRLQAARRAGAERTYADWREMLRTEKPDLVSIGPRWVVDRLEMVTAAAEIGAHVYMEKPIAASLEEADAMLAVARRHGIRVVVAHQGRVAPAVEHLRKLLQDGLIGRLLEIRTRGKEDRRSGGEDLMVLGTHCMYLMRLFGGDAAWCTARVLQSGRDVTRDDRREATEPLGWVAGDSIHATYAFPGSVQGHFASQKVEHGAGRRFQISLHGEKGIVAFPIDQNPSIWHLPDPSWLPGLSGARWEPLPGAPSNDDPTGLVKEEAANKRIVEGLLRWIEGGEESPVSFEEAIRALEMIHAVYAAHLAGGRVALPLESRKHPLE